MNWIKSLLYGLVSGISEFVPISSKGHQSFLNYIFGISMQDPVMQLFVHIGLLLSLYAGFKPFIDQIGRAQAALRHTRSGHRTPKFTADVRFVKNAAVPMVVGMFILSFIFPHVIPLPVVAVLFVVNGVLMYLPERSMQGNKEAGAMSVLDSWLVGILSAFSVLPGISGIGACLSAAVCRGADRKKAVNWALLLSFYAIGANICLDIFSLLSGGGTGPFFSSLLFYLTSGVGAFISGFFGVQVVKTLTSRSSYVGFSCYNWGMALFVFLIYLIVI